MAEDRGSSLHHCGTPCTNLLLLFVKVSPQTTKEGSDNAAASDVADAAMVHSKSRIEHNGIVLPRAIGIRMWHVGVERRKDDQCDLCIVSTLRVCSIDITEICSAEKGSAVISASDCIL
jgi:hypothetical protein